MAGNHGTLKCFGGLPIKAFLTNRVILKFSNMVQRRVAKVDSLSARAEMGIKIFRQTRIYYSRDK